MCFRIIVHRGVTTPRYYEPAVISFPMSAVASNGIVCVAAALQCYAEVFNHSSFTVLHIEKAKTQQKKFVST
jgi:hypothetical protein